MLFLIYNQEAGNILLFSNLSEMQNNTANVRDIALVYNTTNLQGLFTYTNNNWEMAFTGLTTINEYVNSGTFWRS